MAWQDLSQPRVIFHTVYRAEGTLSSPLLGSVVQEPLLWKPTPLLNLSKQEDSTWLPRLGKTIGP